MKTKNSADGLAVALDFNFTHTDCLELTFKVVTLKVIY